MIKNRIFILFIVTSLFSNIVFARNHTPVDMLESTSAKMTRSLDRHLGNLKNNDKLVYDLVNRVLVPHFDLSIMSRAVVGRTYWKKASPNTHNKFIREFKRYIIRTYSSALQEYEGEKIKFYPIRGGTKNKKRVQVDSKILQKDGADIQMQYRLIKKRNKWLIYDFSVDGVSIIHNYRSQFAKTLRQGGMPKLVKQLAKRNKEIK